MSSNAASPIHCSMVVHEPSVLHDVLPVEIVSDTAYPLLHVNSPTADVPNTMYSLP